MTVKGELLSKDVVKKRDLLGLEKITLFPKKETENDDLEVQVYWRGSCYGSRVIRRGDEISVGSECGSAGIYLPTIHGQMVLGNYNDELAHLSVSRLFQCFVETQGSSVSISEFTDMADDQSKIDFQLRKDSLCRIILHYGVEIRIRYLSHVDSLKESALTAADLKFTETILWSGIGHGVLVLFLLITMITAPHEDVPKLDHVPQRFARLLKNHPKQPFKKKEREIAKRITIPKERPVKKVAMPTKVSNKINRYPVQIKSKRLAVSPANVRGRPSSKSREPSELSVLGALGALSTPASLGLEPLAINVNPNAGGFKSLDSQGVIGLIKSKGGTLPMGGLTQVTTGGGEGYGTGKGYGVQGLKGSSGGRQVAGTVVGAPRLFKSLKKDGLTQNQVMEVVERYLGDVQQCYEMALLSDPNLVGRLEYEWLIQPSGRVEHVRVVKSEMGAADQLNGCIKKVFSKMEFPRAQNGQTTEPRIGFPFGRL